MRNTQQGKTIHVYTWLAFLVFSIMIIYAAKGDLWLDEIWSLSFVQNAESVFDIFFRFRHDNNHPLNSLYLYVVGEQNILYIYRVLSVWAGIGSLYLAGLIAKKDWGDWEALFSTILIGSSYPLLLYFTEARGYALAIFLGLAAYATLTRPAEHPTWKRVIAFWTICILGVLSHATYAMLLLAFSLWSAIREWENRQNFTLAAKRLIALYAPPMLFLISWYVFFLRNMEIGGGPAYSKWSVMRETTILLLGFPDLSPLRNIAPVLFLLIVMGGAVSLRQKGDKRWSLFPLVLLIAPTLVVLLTKPTYLYFRYFAVCFPFVYLLMAHLLVNCWHGFTKYGRWLVCAILLTFLVGQFSRNVLLLQFGRGHYRAALEYILEESPDREIRIGSDHDFRNRMLINFYAKRFQRGTDLYYVTHSQFRDTPPDWLITHSQNLAYRPNNKITLEGVGTYRLAQAYRFSGISGWHWFLFRKQNE